MKISVNLVAQVQIRDGVVGFRLDKSTLSSAQRNLVIDRLLEKLG